MCVITARTSRTLVNKNKNQNSVISQQIKFHGLCKSKKEKEKQKKHVCDNGTDFTDIR